MKNRYYLNLVKLVFIYFYNKLFLRTILDFLFFDFMDKSYNDNIRPLLDLADSLPALLKGTSIRIPRIASCGMQSHGKSSTLESITHIPLPTGNNTVTICPIKISLRNAKDKEYARIKFELESDDNYETIQLSQISEKIDEYQKK